MAKFGREKEKEEEKYANYYDWNMEESKNMSRNLQDSKHKIFWEYLIQVESSCWKQLLKEEEKRKLIKKKEKRKEKK